MKTILFKLEMKCLVCFYKIIFQYRRILIGILGTLILTFIGFIIILCFRSYIAEAFLKHLMQSYYIDNSLKDYMDTIQINVSSDYNLIISDIYIIKCFSLNVAAFTATRNGWLRYHLLVVVNPFGNVKLLRPNYLVARKI